MTPTLDRDVAEAIYKLLGDYETEKSWRYYQNQRKTSTVWIASKPMKKNKGKRVPAPGFAELIRLLPKIGEKKGWLKTTFCMGDVSARTVGEDLTWLYMNAPTEEQGMEQVSEYLRKIL